jgi:hypothetical protein
MTNVNKGKNKSPNPEREMTREMGIIGRPNF